MRLWTFMAGWIGVATGVIVTASSPAAAQLGALGNELLHQDSPGLLDISEDDDLFAQALATGDFNNDGFGDLAVGIPQEAIGSLTRAGAVQVLYGAADGTSDADQFWSQESAGILGTAEADDFFGAALAAGDFDDDGFDDLAIGVAGEDIGSLEDAGAVHILYGGSLGLGAAGNQLWHQDSAGVPDLSEPEDHFGSALAAGDFNGDGFDDLAIGIPREDVWTGAVQILYGTSAGLTTTGNQFWDQDSPDVPDSPESGDTFGSSLAAGDFDGDGLDELAIGVPRETVNSVASSAGAVQILHGSVSGLVATGDQFWHQGLPDLLDQDEELDRFGWSLAPGDFNGDEFDDLAIGVPFEGLDSATAAGAAQILYGGAQGLASSGNQFWHQDVTGIADGAEEFDTFGFALSTGDFDGDDFDDLSIGVPGEWLRLIPEVGAVQVLYGGPQGLASPGNQFWHQNATNIVDSAEDGDAFGGALSACDFDGSGFDDLAVGVPSEDVGLVANAGAVHILYSVGIFADGFESGDLSAWSGSSP